MSKEALRLIAEAKAKNSKSLDLGKCGLTEIPQEVFELTHLEALSLCDRYWDYEQKKEIKSKNKGAENKISEVTFSTKQFQQLRKFYLTESLVKDILVLEKLSELKVLYLSSNKIKDISVLEKLSKLHILCLHFNYIKDISILEKLSELQILDLSGNEFKDISVLEKLPNLHTLYLGYNKHIKDIQILKKLPNLHTLYLGGNELQDISVLENLPNLHTLYLGNNELQDISVLENLSKLHKLNISSNQLQDISVLEKLPNLHILYLGGNELQDISILENLSKLHTLDISSNQLQDISVLEKLPNLHTLYLSHNKQVKNFSILENLSKLHTLDLSSNQLQDISMLEGLSNLDTLNLSSNQLQDIRPLKKLIEKNIPIRWESSYESGLYVNQNFWASPPLEIIKQGNQAILDYFQQLDEQKGVALYEAKMLILGEGGAGKTSLMRKLKNRKADLPEEEETTKGIDIEKLQFPCANEQEFTINMWDFGGQEIYHATHQMFLTKRSLYVLVDDTRKDDKSLNDASFRYWLQTVELFGGGSPLLIVQNEKGDRSKDIDMDSMRARFGFIKEKYPTNLLTARGVDELEHDLKHYIQKLPHVGQIVPTQWKVIREALIELSKNEPYISLERYYAICAEHSIPDRGQATTLSQYLHDLGTFLHFQQDDLLRKSVILRNEWATDAVYRVLDNEDIKTRRGNFSKAEAAQIWSDSSYQEMHPELLALMLKFELCYELDNRKGHYLIPQLLPESRPEGLVWDNSYNLQLRYQYEFMPKGLLSRFIVRTHTYLKDISKSWKNGVVLAHNNSTALVTETYARNEIAIRVAGTHQKELLTIIASKIDELNGTFEGIKVQKRIPCNCEVCTGMEEPHFYNYKDVLTRIEYRKDTIECSHPPFEKVYVKKLLDNLFDEPMQAQMRVLRGLEYREDYFLEKQIANSKNVMSDATTHAGKNVIFGDGNVIITPSDNEKSSEVSESAGGFWQQIKKWLNG